MKDELQQHKKSDSVKWVLTLIALLFLFVMTAGICLQLFGQGKTKPSEWFKESENGQTEQSSDKTGEDTSYATIKPLSASAVAQEAEDYGIEAYAARDTLCEHTNYGDTYYYSYGIHQSCTLNFYKESDYFKMDFFDKETGESLFSLEDNYVSLYWGKYNNSYGNPVYITLTTACCHDFLSRIPSGINVDLDSLEWDRGNLTKSVNYDRDRDVLTFTSYDSSSGNHSEIIQSGQYEKFYASIAYSLPPDPVKEGYTFVGWYYDEAFTTPYAGETITAATSLYAKFEINRFTVSFDSNGGSAVESQTVDWNTSANLPTSAKEDHTLLGWYYTDGTKYENQPIKSDTVLRAQWKKTRFLIRFDGNGGSEVEAQRHDIDTVIRNLPSTERTGFNFTGWYCSDGERYENQPITEDMTLTAHWEIIMCKVTFYVDGEVYAEKTVEYGSTFTKVLELSDSLALHVNAVRCASIGMTDGDVSSLVITDDSVEVYADEMIGGEKLVNAVKNNAWKIVGGIAGGVLLIAVLAAVVGIVKRKHRN